MQYEELANMTLAQLREVAKGIEGVTGYSQMNKPHLLAAICKAQGIAMHAHHEVVGIDKTAAKQQIRQLKLQRAEALASGDRARFHRVLRQIHQLKGRLRRAEV
jgi:hypothetical protein